MHDKFIHFFWHLAKWFYKNSVHKKYNSSKVYYPWSKLSRLVIGLIWKARPSQKGKILWLIKGLFGLCWPDFICKSLIIFYFRALRSYILHLSVKVEWGGWYAPSATKRTRGINFFLRFCKYQWFSFQAWYNLSYTVVSADVLQLQYESLGKYFFSFLNNLLQESCTQARLLLCVTKTQNAFWLQCIQAGLK